MEHTSEFNTKLESMSQREALFDESKMRYALRSMPMGAFFNDEYSRRSSCSTNYCWIKPCSK